MKKCFFIVFTVLVNILISAENMYKENLVVKIDQIVSDDYPNMTAFVSVRDSRDEIISGLAPGLFRSRIDSSELKGYQEVVPFSMRSEPIDYTVLISNNGIMEGEPLDYQKSAVIQFIEYMQKDETLSLYCIGDDAIPVFENLHKDEIDNRVINEIITSDTQPRIYDSVINVLRKVDLKKIRRKVIIIISDGRDQNSRFSKEQFDATLNERTIPVYSIGLHVLSSAGLSALNQISESTSGSYLYSSSLSKIPEQLKKIRDYITKCYVIDYKVKNVKADDSYHLLEVAVDERDSEGKGQRPFFAIKLPVPKWLQIVFIVIGLVLVIVLIILAVVIKIKKRKAMGITTRKCPVCKYRMKDSWDYCPFCKYMPELSGKKQKAKKE